VDQYIGQLVVLQSRWNLRSSRLGLVIGQDFLKDPIVLVLWTEGEGVKLRYHLQDAVLPVNDQTIKKIEERICDIK